MKTRILGILLIITIFSSFFNASVNANSPTILLTEAEQQYLQELGSITMCVDPDWVPFEHLDEKGNFTGIAADLIELVATRLGITIEIIPTIDWPETLEYSKAGKCMILPFLNQTPEREEWLVFTEPLLIDENVIITRQEYPYISDLSAVTDKTIVLPKGTSIEERVRKDFPNLTIITTVTESEALQMVENKQADMTLRSLTIAAYTIRAEGYFNLKIAGRVPQYTNYLRMGVLKEEPMLRDILNKGIATITPQEREEIINRHVYIKIEEGTNYKLLVQVATVAVLLTGLLLYWNYRQKQMNKKMKILKAEAELAKKHFKTIFQTIPDPTLITTLDDFRIIDYNQAYLDNSSYTEADIAAKVQNSMYLYTNDSEKKEVIKEELLAYGFCNNIEVRLLNKEGQQQIGQISAKLFYSDTEPLVINVIRDITIAKNTEKKLWESERRINLIFENSPIGIINFSPAGEIIAVNNHFCSILDITKEQATQINMLELRNEQIVNCIKQTLNGEVTHYEDIYTSVISGKEVMVRATFTPLIDDNIIIGGIGIIEDFTERKRLEEEIKKLSVTDKLTQIYNRLKLDEALEQELIRAKRTGEIFSVILTDIDRFKAVNDNYGHQTGDLVLKEFATILKEGIRASDIVGRWGGEEFLIIAPDTKLENACILAEKLRTKIEVHSFVDKLKITSSFGVATFKDDNSVSAIISRADDSLYKAKKGGRNAVIC
ncbi:diguanylate cyclase [Desulfuribacillus alkaliarsenatis]|uniref:Diguanylate cyclase n=1 Tax=Desulfuribacillus alkaliarsenatis TaxID=766136 RepID=A0A1E5G152_9FIRM|nr:diguanylate cyclase [Desulfuribacillus alkaliarsenatis]OEF96636.1 hypothetical protein BHF68_08315 [Desulfuribacillus alkaliarsenatis]